MKRLISFLIVIWLLIMPVAMAEDIELNNLFSVDGDFEDIELDIENLKDGFPEEFPMVRGMKENRKTMLWMDSARCLTRMDPDIVAVGKKASALVLAR